MGIVNYGCVGNNFHRCAWIHGNNISVQQYNLCNMDKKGGWDLSFKNRGKLILNTKLKVYDF